MPGPTHLDIPSLAPQAIDNVNITESDSEWLNGIDRKKPISEGKGKVITKKDANAHCLLSEYYQADKKRCYDKKRH
jgi:hypothetical protein